MDTIIDIVRQSNMKNDSPLASRMRPRNIDEIVGQEAILGRDKLLYKMIKADAITSVIFYGPPGVGKTTIAKVIANTTKSNFMSVNATNASKEDLKNVIDSAKRNLVDGTKTILFIDEIHRFNKAQQDYLLPFVEDGTITLIGATTENPYFEVNSALLSRSRIFELTRLHNEDIKKIIKVACYDKERGYGALNIEIDEEAVDFLARMSNGDARLALNAIELATRTIKVDGEKVHITLDIVKDCIGRHGFSYDKNGDMHYDTISAFIKSMRGSDEDATIYYLGRMLLSGEDIKFIARRIVICAAEDVGLADPNALVVATNAFLAVERVGMPESNLILSEAALYVARAPKSNAVTVAINNAYDEIKLSGNLPIPKHLQDAHYSGAKDLNRGIGYLYPHDYEGHYVEQQYLPDEIKNKKFFDM